jgi:hypothetical protein
MTNLQNPKPRNGNLSDTIQTLHYNLDAVERFLALHDLFRMTQRDRLSVAEVTRISDAMALASEDDRDLNVRVWAKYYHERLWGKRGQEPKPYRPKLWELLIVEDV